ncbi:MAG: two-component regulator propeller domain-containing protein, partial [Bacteroidota bacterium]
MIVVLRKILFLSAVVLCSTCLHNTLFALNPTKNISQYGLDMWDESRGLSAFAIHAIKQTKDGYIWLGTDVGLIRFDGVEFTTFSSATVPRMSDNSIMSLAEDGNGNLWFAMLRGGLGKYYQGKFYFYTKENGLPTNEVVEVFVDSKNNLWLGFMHMGIARFQNEKAIVIPTEETSQFNNVRTIFEDSHNRIWFGTGNFKYYNKDFSVTKIPQTTSEILSVICEDAQGTIWGGKGDGLYFIKDGKENLFSFAKKDFISPIREVIKDKSGNLWIGTEGDGLFRYTNGTLSQFNLQDGLKSNRIISICEDREGNLWLGTRGGGLCRLKDKNISVYAEENGLSSDYVHCVFEDSKQRLWIGLRNSGVDVFENGKFTQHYSTANGLLENQVRAIEEDAEGNMWFGSISGLSQLMSSSISSTPRFHYYNNLHDPHDNKLIARFRSVYSDKNNIIWCGSYGAGVVIIRGKEISFNRLPHYNETTNSFVRVITEDNNGILWIGTQAGINRIEDTTITFYGIKEGMPDNEVFAFHFEDDSTMWIGTYNAGLIRYKNGKFISINKKHGLYDNVVFSILADSNGYFWMSSNHGIFRASRQELNDCADGKISSITSVSFGMDDGMKSVECNGGSTPTSVMTRDGMLVFPTVKGFVLLNPNDINNYSMPPQVIFERLISNEDTLLVNEPLALSPGKKKFEIEYTALSFFASEKIRFRYMLEGFETQWNEAETRRKAYYTNIPAGEYTFRVIAASNTGEWNSQGAVLKIIIPPHIWETWWFQILTFLLIAGGIT